MTVSTAALGTSTRTLHGLTPDVLLSTTSTSSSSLLALRTIFLASPSAEILSQGPARDHHISAMELCVQPSDLLDCLDGQEAAEGDGEKDEEDASGRVLPDRSWHPRAGVEWGGGRREEDHHHVRHGHDGGI